MSNKIVFFNIGWMTNYQGLTDTDNILGGGKHVEERKFGGEIFNFKSYRGLYYGAGGGTFNIKRLGGKKNDLKLDNVTIVWVSKNPRGNGTFIVGWYKDATVYRHWQPTKIKHRKYKKSKIDFLATAKTNNCKLLPKLLRNFKIPRGKNGMGQYNIWYADKKSHKLFVDKVIKYIDNDGLIPKIKKQQSKGKKFIQTDILKRNKVEKTAIEVVTKYYESIGFKIKSVEKDNVGWDLNAYFNEELFYRIEVKGLSGNKIYTELTPNEFNQMKKYSNSYHICIVSGIDKKINELNIFQYSIDNKKWENEDGVALNFDIIKSARVYI